MKFDSQCCSSPVLEGRPSNKMLHVQLPWPYMCTASYCTYCSCPDPWGTAFIVDVNQIDGFTTWVLRLSACSNNPDLLPKKANKIVAMQELLHNSAFLHLASQNTTLIELLIIVCAGRRSCSTDVIVQISSSQGHWRHHYLWANAMWSWWSNLPTCEETKTSGMCLNSANEHMCSMTK